MPKQKKKKLVCLLLCLTWCQEMNYSWVTGYDTGISSIFGTLIDLKLTLSLTTMIVQVSFYVTVMCSHILSHSDLSNFSSAGREAK